MADYSSSTESQSSQILDFVLGKSAPLATCNNGNGTTFMTLAGDQHETQNTSAGDGSEEDSLLGSSVTSAHKYNFHGLAGTQLESQSASDSAVDLDNNSQKENTPTGSSSSNAQQQHLPPRASQKPAVPSFVNHPLTNLPTAPLTSRPAVREPRTVTFRSPLPQKPKTDAAMRFRRRREPSSQDSFAGPSALEDPDLFVATSKQLECPLDELGRSHSQSPLEKASAQEGAESSAAQNPRFAEDSKPQLTPYSLSSTSSHYGRILVENSDESRNTSQNSMEGQNTGASFDQQVGHPEEDGQEATQLAEDQSSSSSVHAFDEEPTQVVEESSQSEPETTNQFLQSTTDMAIDRSSGNFSTLSQPRSLLSLVDPEKRARYMKPNANFTPRVAGTENDLVPPLKGKSSTVIVSSAPTQDLEVKIPSKATSSKIGAHSVPDSTPDIVPDSEMQVEEQLSSTPNNPALIREFPVPLSMPVLPRQNERKGKGKRKIGLIEDLDDEEDEVGRDSMSPLQARKGAKKPVKKLKSTVVSRVASPLDDSANEPPTTHILTRSSRRAQDEETKPARQQRATTRRGRGRPRKSAGQVKNVPQPLSKRISKRVIDELPHTPVTHSPTEMDVSPDVPLAIARTVEEGTEVADDHPSDGSDDDNEQPLPGPSRKRELSHSSISIKRSIQKNLVSQQTSMTGLKRIRSSATRVLALWKTDACYYSGTVHEVKNLKYLIKFDDGCEDWLELDEMRKFKPKSGDSVVIQNPKASGRVISFSTDQSTFRELIRVTVSREGEEEEEAYNSEDIHVPARSVVAEWKDRFLEHEEIIPVKGLIPKSLGKNGTPSKQSMNTSQKNRNMARIGFVVTFTVGKGDNQDGSNRHDVERTIKDCGGIVFDDWSDVFSLQGRFSNGGKRWSMSSTDLKYIGEGIDRVFLIADQPNQKTKYLFALALGIPCVSMDWINALAEDGSANWDTYLLAAGYSSVLQARVSQMVDLGWGASVHHLTDIMNNSVPAKVLTDQKILCLGDSLLPKSTKAPSDGNAEALKMVPRILLSMGAKQVEAVSKESHASAKLQSYDLVFVKDLPKDFKGVKYGDIKWMKECLFASRNIPLPN